MFIIIIIFWDSKVLYPKKNCQEVSSLLMLYIIIVIFLIVRILYYKCCAGFHIKYNNIKIGLSILIKSFNTEKYYIHTIFTQQILHYGYQDLPDFDFGHTVGRPLASTEGTRVGGVDGGGCYRFRWLVSEEGGEAGFGDARGEFGGVEAREVGEFAKDGDGGDQD